MKSRTLFKAQMGFSEKEKRSREKKGKSRLHPFTLSLRLLVVLLALPQMARAQWVQQTIQLKPGWNAVFLEVDPEPKECNALLASLPVESVWDFNPSVDSPQFVQDPATLIPGSPNWLTWFPPISPIASQGNLFILRDGRPYLIKLANNAAPTTWTVTGKPSLRKTTWRPGGVNLVGFRVGTQGPTFQSLFAGESGLAGQPVYRLNSTGAWEAVANLSTTRPLAGEAYWVRCQSPAQWTATVEADLGSRRGLIFAGGLAESALRIRNTSSAARNISLRLVPSATPPAGQPPLAGPPPLEYWKSDLTNVDIGWEPFPATLNFSALPAGAEWNIRLGVRRASGGAAPVGSQFQGLLEVTDDLGTRWLVPVSADASSGVAAAGAPHAQGGSDFALAGLWVGEAVLNAVSQPAHPTNPTLPRPTGQFSFRLIVHADAAGTSRLLQRVYLVRKPPTYVPDPQNPGFNIIDQPSRAVVLTDESLITSIIGSGEVAGRRISSAAFGFGQPLGLTGGMFGAGTLNGTITLDYDDPLNPFKHVYHPDHNNLDERFEQKLPAGKESFTVVRTVSFEFTPNDPLGLNPPGWGDSEVGGIYRETISGLHRSAVQVSGNFRLVRASRTSVLNQ